MARERLDLRLPSTYVDLPPIFLAAASRAAPLAHNPDVRPVRGRATDAGGRALSIAGRLSRRQERSHDFGEAQGGLGFSHIGGPIFA